MHVNENMPEVASPEHVTTATINTDLNDSAVSSGDGALTAGLRMLSVDSRRVTKTIAKQLDFVATTAIDPMGRIKSNWGPPLPTTCIPGTVVTVIGRDRDTGALVLSHSTRSASIPTRELAKHSPHLFRFVEGRSLTGPRSVWLTVIVHGHKITVYKEHGDEGLESVAGHEAASDARLADYDTAARNAVDALDTYADTWSQLPLIVLPGR